MDKNNIIFRLKPPPLSDSDYKKWLNEKEKLQKDKNKKLQKDKNKKLQKESKVLYPVYNEIELNFLNRVQQHPATDIKALALVYLSVCPKVIPLGDQNTEVPENIDSFEPFTEPNLSGTLKQYGLFDETLYLLRFLKPEQRSAAYNKPIRFLLSGIPEQPELTANAIYDTLIKHLPEAIHSIVWDYFVKVAKANYRNHSFALQREAFKVRIKALIPTLEESTPTIEISAKRLLYSGDRIRLYTVLYWIHKATGESLPKVAKTFNQLIEIETNSKRETSGISADKISKRNSPKHHMEIQSRLTSLVNAFTLSTANNPPQSLQSPYRHPLKLKDRIVRLASTLLYATGGLWYEGRQVTPDQLYIYICNCLTVIHEQSNNIGEPYIRFIGTIQGRKDKVTSEILSFIK